MPTPQRSWTPCSACRSAQRRAKLGAEREHRVRGDVDDHDLDAQRAGAGRHLAADEAGADDDQTRAGRQRRAQRLRVVEAAQGVHARQPRPPVPGHCRARAPVATISRS